MKTVRLLSEQKKIPTFVPVQNIIVDRRGQILQSSPPKARMAESVDATVSNTVGAIHPGSIPGPGTDNDC